MSKQVQVIRGGLEIDSQLKKNSGALQLNSPPIPAVKTHSTALVR
jgi:hypothetical protein